MAKWRDVKQNRIQEEKIIEPIKKLNYDGKSKSKS